MVKGITRRVIVIKSPDKRLFDEAIFIVKEDALTDAGVTGDDILKEAQTVADSYIRANLKSGVFPKIPAPFFALAGAGFTTLVWFLVWYLF